MKRLHFSILPFRFGNRLYFFLGLFLWLAWRLCLNVLDFIQTWCHIEIHDKSIMVVVSFLLFFIFTVDFDRNHKLGLYIRIGNRKSIIHSSNPVPESLADRASKQRLPVVNGRCSLARADSGSCGRGRCGGWWFNNSFLRLFFVIIMIIILFSKDGRQYLTASFLGFCSFKQNFPAWASCSQSHRKRRRTRWTRHTRCFHLHRLSRFFRDPRIWPLDPVCGSDVSLPVHFLCRRETWGLEVTEWGLKSLT